MNGEHASERAVDAHRDEPQLRRLVLFREGFADDPLFDASVSQAVLDVDDTDSLRLFRPGRAVSFGRQDCLAPGYQGAREAAAARGFISVERAAGGRAAAYHESTVAVVWTIRDPDARAHIRQHYHRAAMVVAEALRAVGADALVGAVPGEYCPGDFSVNAGGRVKLAGLAQRLTKEATQVGGMIVASQADVIRDVLNPVYAALGIPWDDRTAGSVVDEAPGATWDSVAEAIVGSFARRYALMEQRLSPCIIARAAELAREAPAVEASWR